MMSCMHIDAMELHARRHDAIDSQRSVVLRDLILVRSVHWP